MKRPRHSSSNILLLVSLIIICSSCSSRSQLPDSWQPGMILKITYGGGMRDYSSLVEVKETGSYQLIEEDGQTKQDTLSFAKKELDALLQLLKNKNFDQIKTIKRDGIVHDKPTSTISLQWDKNILEITISATENISTSDEADYRAIKQYIDNLLKKKQP